METHGTGHPEGSADDARAALDLVDGVNADLADRMITPWWYHPGVGLAEALMISSLTFPDPIRFAAVIIALAGLAGLVSAYTKMTGLGVSTSYASLARGWVIALVAVIVAALTVVLLMDDPVVTAVTAAVVFVAMIVLGRNFDRAVRNRLRRDSQGS